MSTVTPKGSPSDVLDDHWASELVRNVLTAIATENVTHPNAEKGDQNIPILNEPTDKLLLQVDEDSILEEITETQKIPEDAIIPQESIIDRMVVATDEELEKIKEFEAAREKLKSERITRRSRFSEPDQTKHYLSAASSITHAGVKSQGLSMADGLAAMTYKTPSEILDALNIDKRTHIDIEVSDSELDHSHIFPESERTLAIIKPDAVKFRNHIEERIKAEGFIIMSQRKIQLSPEQASEFYRPLYGSLEFPTLIVYMSSAPIVVYCLSRIKAIEHWRHVIGPKNVRDAELYWPSSLRGKYGCDGVQNAIHGSHDQEEADREIRFFFPNTILEPIPVEEAATDYLDCQINPVLSKGLAELLKEKPGDPILWFADWLLWNNPNRPRFPEAIAQTNT